jgi:hypothetical protein
MTIAQEFAMMNKGKMVRLIVDKYAGTFEYGSIHELTGECWKIMSGELLGVNTGHHHWRRYSFFLHELELIDKPDNNPLPLPG